jgi:hypothetical protein
MTRGSCGKEPCEIERLMHGSVSAGLRYIAVFLVTRFATKGLLLRPQTRIDVYIIRAKIDQCTEVQIRSEGRDSSVYCNRWAAPGAISARRPNLTPRRTRHRLPAVTNLTLPLFRRKYGRGCWYSFLYTLGRRPLSQNSLIKDREKGVLR